MALVCTVDVWFSISDGSCVVHDPSFWAPANDWRQFLGKVRALEATGDLIKQEVVMDGCFLVQLVVTDEKPGAAIIDPMREGSQILRLPTGSIVVRSGGPDRDPALLLKVEPGVYEARVEWFVDEESKHYDLDDPDEYPEGDGPDGVVTLRFISPDNP